MKRFLRYLRRTNDTTMLLDPGNDDEGSAYVTEMLCAETCTGRGSSFEGMIRHGSSPTSVTNVLWKSMALSSTEARYIPLSIDFRIMTCFRSVLQEVDII